VLVLFLTTPAPVAASHHERVLKESSGKKPLQTERPYNIAHRGANGELPEETHAAYEVCNRTVKFRIPFPSSSCLVISLV
jgi:hypothetical protein